MATAGNNLSDIDLDSLPDASNMRFAVVVSKWNTDITSSLSQAAIDILKTKGATDDNITICNVPGSFELIYGSKKMAKSENYDAVIAIGSVIQGETKHFDFVCEAVSQGIKELNVIYDTPTVFCLLTDFNKQQAIDRSGGKHGNKGAECAAAAIEMAHLKSL